MDRLCWLRWTLVLTPLSCYSQGQNSELARAASVVLVPRIVFTHDPKNILKLSWVSPEVGVRRKCAIYLMTLENPTRHINCWEGQVAKNHKDNPKSIVSSCVHIFLPTSAVGKHKIGTFFSNIGWKTSSKAELGNPKSEQRKGGERDPNAQDWGL